MLDIIGEATGQERFRTDSYSSGTGKDIIEVYTEDGQLMKITPPG